MHESYTRTNYFTQPQQEYAYNLRQVDNHATIDLHPEANHTSRRPNSAAAYTNHVYDGDFYEEDLNERAFTKYESHKAPKHNRGTPLTQTVPIRRTSSSHTSQEERRLQRELEEQLRHRSNYHDRNDDFIERIEEQLRSQHYHQQQRNVEPEAYREETIRTMHQSSVI
ncbi:hypothetical protein M3Y97_00830500 [Aphelenchoides bicaudatus]|nr:hypothetical protein M3Y97_00830500 [Aphelenchoides bicaudatus]